MKLKSCRGILWGLAMTGGLVFTMLVLGHTDRMMFRGVQQYPLNIEDGSKYAPQEQCNPVTRVAFLKVHKAGSSTVANILQRFGYTRNLNFVVPRKNPHEYGYNYIGKRGDTVSRDKIIPLPPGEEYDILWNHVTYDHNAFRAVMPSDTKYISILREPFDQFVSAYEYYALSGKRRNLTNIQNRNPLAEYLDSDRLLTDPKLMTHFRNSQSFDMGFALSEVKDLALRQRYINILKDDFHLILLVEYFDESLVLLKRMFCWSIKDILYFTHNRNIRRKQRMFRQDHYEKHKVISSSDYSLYNEFRTIFWEKVWNEGPSFFEEVRYFKNLLHQLRDYCLQDKILVVPASEWSDGFVVDRADCQYLRITELRFFDKIMHRTYGKLAEYDQQSH